MCYDRIDYDRERRERAARERERAARVRELLEQPESDISAGYPAEMVEETELPLDPTRV